MTDAAPVQPAWMAAAWAELGQRERAGAGVNPRIAGYYRAAGHPEVKDDETPWCAAFLGACLERAGIGGTRSLMARSYLRWGDAIAAPRLGAVAVLSRGEDPAAGHVGFWVGESGDDILLLGGNQGDAVGVEALPRSRLLGLRWPPAAPAGAAARSAPAADPFEMCLAHVLEMEGGWTDDPYDPGGPTHRGITLATLARHRGVVLEADTAAGLEQALRAITDDEVRAIYRARYWRPARCGEMAAGVALMHFDAAVNHGVTGAARLLQGALGVAADGEIGPETMAVLAAAEPASLLAAYAEARRARYRGLPHFWRFGRGWLRRVDATLALAMTLARAAGTAATVAFEPSLRHGEIDMSTTSETGTAAAPAPAQSPSGADGPKWWGHSMTIWGAIITTLATVLPALGPLLGLDITAEMIRQLGQQAVGVAQAVAGLVGTLLTIYGRARARTPLTRREVRLNL